jgi:Fic family protein
LGYYTALKQVEAWAAQEQPVTEKVVQITHALVIGSGNEEVEPTPYRDGQNVIKDGRTHAIVYLPPEAHDVPLLMQQLVAWLAQAREQQLQCPIIAGIAHYQFVTIHPYYDGNGRTARLLATLLLYEGGYRLKGLYTLDEHYAYNLGKYYESLTVGPSHNYYFGREEADITPWLEYFCEGMAVTCENGLQRVKNRV